MAAAMFNPNFEAIGQAFIEHYYKMFDVLDPNTRAQSLALLYDPQNSYMTFEGTQVKGKDAILQKFAALTFRQIQRGVTKVDYQPLADGSILVTVLGQLKLQTDEDPVQSYLHTFVLKPTADGSSFFISNEIFRLVLHNTAG